MKNKLFYPILAVATLLLLQTSKVIGQFSIDGEFRPRTEIRDGFRLLRDSASKTAALVTQRSRISMNYKSDALVTKISLQDVRVWGDEVLKKDIPSAAVHEAWAEVKVMDSVSLKVGRQELSYDNQRLLGGGNWLQQAIAHDAALVKFHYNGLTADLGYSFNQTHDTILNATYYSYTKDNYKSLGFLYVSYKMSPLTISGLAISDVYQKVMDTTYSRYTTGVIAEFKQGAIAASARGFLQTGKTIKGQDIAAQYFSADVSYAIGKLKPSAGFEYISGNDNSNKTDKKFHAFNTLYATGHKFNGSMEYFSKPKGMPNAGLIDIYLGAAYKATDKVSCRADYHYFSLQNDFLNAATAAKIDKYLGSEVDLSVKSDVSKEVSLEVGYSFLAAGKSLEVLQSRKNDGKLNSWAFVMLTIKPRFL